MQVKSDQNKIMNDEILRWNSCQTIIANDGNFLFVKNAIQFAGMEILSASWVKK